MAGFDDDDDSLLSSHNPDVIGQEPAPPSRRATALAVILCVALGFVYALFSWRTSHVPFDSPLHRACYEGNIGEVQRLIARGANVNLQGPVNSGDTPLILAIASNSNRLPLASILIARGANVNLADKAGRSTLDIAIMYDEIPIVQLLLDHGAMINAEDHEGHRPLSYAGIWTMNKPMRDFLIAHGAH